MLTANRSFVMALLKEDKNIKVGDVVVLEFDDIVVEASVIETEDNNIVLEFDEFAMTVLENFNSLTEDESYGELVQIDEDWIPLAEPAGNYKHDPKDRGTPVHGPIPTNRPQQTSPAKKAGVSSILRWKSIVVGTPVIAHSRRARFMRLIAVSRFSPQTINLPIRES
jgi:hypothetical protein